MGFLDKAKQMAEQAQEKLDETQKKFNESQQQRAAASTPAAPPVEYDAHGRPVGGAPAPPAPPPAEAPAADPAAPPEIGRASCRERV